MRLRKTILCHRPIKPVARFCIWCYSDAIIPGVRPSIPYVSSLNWVIFGETRKRREIANYQIRLSEGQHHPRMSRLEDSQQFRSEVACWLRSVTDHSIIHVSDLATLKENEELTYLVIFSIRVSKQNPNHLDQNEHADNSSFLFSLFRSNSLHISEICGLQRTYLVGHGTLTWKLMARWLREVLGCFSSLWYCLPQPFRHTKHTHIKMHSEPINPPFPSSCIN